MTKCCKVILWVASGLVVGTTAPKQRQKTSNVKTIFSLVKVATKLFQNQACDELVIWFCQQNL